MYPLEPRLTFIVRLPLSEGHQFEALAAERGMSRAALLRWLMRRELAATTTNTKDTP